MNERDFPHLVELELPAGGFRNKSQEFESFHRERRIVIRRGCVREQFHVRFCFPDAATADAFQGPFGGTRLTHSPTKPGRPSGPRSRYQRSYLPRVPGGKLMTPADLRLLRKYMLETEKVSAISDEMRAVVESGAGTSRAPEAGPSPAPQSIVPQQINVAVSCTVPRRLGNREIWNGKAKPRTVRRDRGDSM
jgi:hypothetical protein